MTRRRTNRDALDKVNDTYSAAAKATWDAPPEIEWYPQRAIAATAPPLTKDRVAALFADNILKAEQKALELKAAAKSKEAIAAEAAADFLRRQLKKWESGKLKLGGEDALDTLDDGDALSELSRLAEALMRRRPGMSFAQAFTEVYTAPENQDLAERERQQNRPRPSAADSLSSDYRAPIGLTELGLLLRQAAKAAEQAAGKLVLPDARR